MPLITIKGIEGVFSSDQKAEIIRRVTDAMVSVEGENMRRITWVVFEEVQDGHWGIGGEIVSAAYVKSVQDGTA